MKVSIVTSFPFPDGKATANRIRVFAEELIKSPKIECIEIFCSSNDPSCSYLVNDSLRVTCLKVNHIDKNKFVTRAFHELLLAFRLFWKSRQSKFDVTIVTIPSVLLLMPLIFNIKKNPIALDLRDAVWTYFDDGFLSRIVGKFIAMIFSFAARRSEIISVTNVAEYEQIKEITGRFPLLVANGISQAKLEEMQSISRSPQCDYIKLAYIGNVGIAQELNQLIDFSKEIPDLEVKIIGDGAKLESLKLKCVSEDIKNVIFTGSVPPADIGKHMEPIDILFAQIGPDYRTAVPTKVFEYIASGRKILLGLPEGPAREIFSTFHGVEIFDVGSRIEFIKSYNKLVAFNLSIENKKSNIDKLRDYYLREKNAKVLVDSITALDINKN